MVHSLSNSIIGWGAGRGKDVCVLSRRSTERVFVCVCEEHTLNEKKHHIIVIDLFVFISLSVLLFSTDCDQSFS